MPFSDPPYPVINPSPNVDNCVESMRSSDYLFLGTSTAATWTYGYLLGKPLRAASASTAAALGLTFAGFYVLQNTRNRLMGYKENTVEVGKYGLYPEQPKGRSGGEDVDRRFPKATRSASYLVKPDVSYTNYD